MAHITCARVDTAGVTAEVQLIHSVSDYDFIAISAAGSGVEDYITYEYNAPKTARGSIRIAHTAATRSAAKLVLRYYDAQSKLLAESAPFTPPSAPSGAVRASVSAQGPGPGGHS